MTSSRSDKRTQTVWRQAQPVLDAHYAGTTSAAPHNKRTLVTP